MSHRNVKAEIATEKAMKINGACPIFFKISFEILCRIEKQTDRQVDRRLELIIIYAPLGNTMYSGCLEYVMKLLILFKIF